MKARLNLSVDADLIEKAKTKFLNISKITENAIREKLNIKDVIIEEGTLCQFCGREGIKETAKTINQSDNGLTWIYPDEKWICNHCLRRQWRPLVP